MESSEAEICSNCGRKIGDSEKAYVVDGGLICLECDRKLQSGSAESASICGSSEIEICSNCGRGIDRSEQTCVFNGEIVCAECDEKLRIGSELQSEGSTDSGLLSNRSSQKSKWLAFHEASKIGIIVAVLVILAGICLFLFDRKPKPEMHEITIGGYPKLDQQGNIVGWVEKETIKGIIEPPKVNIFVKVIGVLTWLGAGLCLVVRSFRSGLGLWQGILTLVGGFIMSGVISIGFLVVLRGSPDNPFGTVAGLALCLALGAILLRNGFKPRKSYS